MPRMWYRGFLVIWMKPCMGSCEITTLCKCSPRRSQYHTQLVYIYNYIYMYTYIGQYCLKLDYLPAFQWVVIPFSHQNCHLGPSPLFETRPMIPHVCNLLPKSHGQSQFVNIHIKMTTYSTKIYIIQSVSPGRKCKVGAINQS